MNPDIVIRSETEADADAITEVTIAAFRTLEISNQTEHFIVDDLRAAEQLQRRGTRATRRHVDPATDNDRSTGC